MTKRETDGRLTRFVSFGVDAKSRFADGTPPVKAFWAAAAAACRVSGQPFGANPHSLVG